MAMPTDVGIIDTMIDFPHGDMKGLYKFITDHTHDKESKEDFEFPVEYMFKDVPDKGYQDVDDPIAVTVAEMDKWGIAQGVVGVGGVNSPGELAIKRYPGRFIASGNADPNKGVAGTKEIRRLKDEFDIRAVGMFPSGTFPQVAINDPLMYPIYNTCAELGIAVFCCAGVPGPRLQMAPQRVELIDQVMYDFPELTFVTRHGCEPWEDLAVKLMLKWPNLYYSTTAFAPKHFPKDIINYANTRGADKIIWSGYLPAGLSYDRIFAELPAVPFRDHVWPKFLHENSTRVFKLD